MDFMPGQLSVARLTPEAIAQIKDKNYGIRFEGKPGGEPGYTGRVLAVGISYSKETKEHSCRIEVLKTFH